MATAYLITAAQNPTGLGIALVDVHGNVAEILEPAEPQSTTGLHDEDPITHYIIDQKTRDGLDEIGHEFGLRFSGLTSDRSLGFTLVDQGRAFEFGPFLLGHEVHKRLRAASSEAVQRLVDLTKGVSIDL